MPGFHLFGVDLTIPGWFLYLVGLLPVPEWAKIAIEAAYLIFVNLPFIHKPGALLDLRKSIAKGKKTQPDGPVASNDDQPVCHEINQWCQRWNQMTKAKRDGVPSEKR